MPIDSLNPKTVGQYLQPPLAAAAVFRMELSTTSLIRITAMPMSELPSFMLGGKCSPFYDSWVPRVDDQVIEFPVQADKPWVIVVVNTNTEHAAVYWRAFLRH